MKSAIFKSYDIRGVYPDEIDADAVHRIGKAVVQFLRARTLIAGRDMRTSSPELFEAVARGVTGMGCDVLDIGMCSTPMFYFAVAKYECDGGMMVTASHNPGKYNGLKLCREKAIPVGSDSGLLDVKSLAEQELKLSRTQGTVHLKDIFKEYTSHVLSFVDSGAIKGKKVVVDCGNGMAGVTEVRVLEQLPCEWTILERQPDGRFPHHEPNPVKEENIKDLKEEVLRQRADIGIAFDGDCDRVLFVDENGDTCDGSLTAALISQSLLKEHPGSKMIYTPIQSHILPETIKQFGGVPLLHRVGHAFIKQTMRKENVLFASEKSGHFYYRDNFNADSSVITALKVLEILCLSGKKFSELLKPLRKYATSDELNFEVADKDGKIKEIEGRYKSKAKKVHYVDGLTMEFDRWWFNVRKSGTEPLLRLNVEADNKRLLTEKVAELKNVIEG